MKFETKCKLGDTVYTIQKAHIYTECSLCKGVGVVLAEIEKGEYSVTCPKCRGSKRIAISDEPLWSVREEVSLGISSSSPKIEAVYKVKQIIVSEIGIFYKIALVGEGANLSRFSIDRLSRTVDEAEVFTSKEEAIEYCNKMNGIEPLLDGEKQDV